MVSQSRPRSARIASPCSLNSGRALRRRRAPRRTAPARRPAGTACRRRSRSPGRSRWRPSAGRPPPRACPAPPPTGRRSRRAARATRRAVAAANDLGRGSRWRRRCWRAATAWSAKRGSVASSGRPIDVAQRAASTCPACRQVNASAAAVLGAVVARRAGCGAAASVGRRRPRARRAASDSAIAWPMAQSAGAEQRHVDDRRLAGALAVEQRAHDPAGDRHARRSSRRSRAPAASGTRSYSGRLTPIATPARAQNASESYEPLSASGPRSPWPVPRT